MLQEVLTINDIQYIPTKNKLINKNLDFGLFYSVSKNELYLFLTNKTSKNIELPAIKIDNKSPNEVFLSQLKGEKLSSKMGVHISNSNSAAAEIVLKNEIIDLNTWVIPSFSINKVTFQLK